MTQDPLDYLFSLEHFGIKLGLENIQTLVAALGHPERAFDSVHIAGTNGKGSVTAMVDSILRAAGYRVGRYTSPHLVHLTERFAIDGTPISELTLRHVMAHIRTTVSVLQSSGALTVHPTFFEATTAAAFEVFRAAAVQVAVCEVGLGGRLDATNVLSPVATAITSIAFDHQQHLGHTLAAIAGEKAGIIKSGIPVVAGPMPTEAAAVIANVANQRHAPLVVADEGVMVTGVKSLDGDGHSFHLRTRAADYGTVRLPLAGGHQVTNAIVAVRVVECLPELIPVPADAVRRGLATVRWPGRLQRIAGPNGSEALLDAAHNPAGAESLAAFLAGDAMPRPLVFAAMKDKDARGVLAPLLPHVSAVVVTRASNPRAMETDALSSLVRSLDPAMRVVAEDDPRAAVEHAWRLSPRIIVAGSIFLLGDVLSALARS